MVRTQLYLDEVMHARLRGLARKQGRTVSDLVRTALERAYGAASDDERLATLDAMAGIWQERNDIGSSRAYVRRLRSDTKRSRRNRN